MLMGELRRNQAVSHPLCHLPQSLVNDSVSWKYKFRLILLPSSFFSLNGTSVCKGKAYSMCGYEGGEVAQVNMYKEKLQSLSDHV